MVESQAPAPVGLVSMPWSAAALPSIQLATLDAALRNEGLSSDRHELYLDFCAQLTPALYNRLANENEFLIEWLFSRDYFGNETGNWLTEFEANRPKIELPNNEYETEIVEGLKAAALHFLNRCQTDINWQDYDIIGFSLSTQQLGASIAMARRIKIAHPEIRIVFGGSMCTGDAGGALLKLCPYIDAVVRSEGEHLFPKLIRRWRAGRSTAGLKGLSYRSKNGEIINEAPGPLFENNTPRPYLNYDPYFEKINKYELMKRVNPIMAFESSRGCWWGEKSQCSFCGLHEIMKYRPKQQDFVLAEMEHLGKRHSHDRFYAVDLIAPKPFYSEFFPEIERRGHKWQLFYEIKSNVTREQLIAFASGGGHVIQPGIESLQDASLRRMHKGAHVLQNIQLLKWCKEMDLMVYWNYLMSLPGEEASDYAGASEKARQLFHLEPPSTIRDVLITRYAPYHKTPEKYDVTNLRPHHFYAQVFPAPAPILADIAYLFEGDWPTQTASQNYTSKLKQACLEWKEAGKTGVVLDAYKQTDGSLKITDTRNGTKIEHVLDQHETNLYLLMDSKQLISRLSAKFQRSTPESAARITATSSITNCIERWLDNGLALKEGEQILALAVKRWQDPGAAIPKKKATQSSLTSAIE